MRTLADMTPEERQACVGMWCEYKDGNGTKLAVIVETWLTDPEACMAYDISCHENRHPLGGDVTPRPDLPRAWNPDGTPRAWLQVIERRTAPDADAELQEVMGMARDVLKPLAPSIFGRDNN